MEAPAPERTDCLLCQGHSLLSSVAFEALPVLCNSLHLDAGSARSARTGRFATMYCRECTHVFNAAFDESQIDYTQNYETSLHFSRRFTVFADALAARLNKTYSLGGKTVVDIGCGKGDFLTQLCVVSGAKGIGFDKSFEKSRDKSVPGVRFVNDWFSNAYADLRPDLVLCRHVLEHIAEPVTFLRALRTHPGVGSETVFYFEVPNALYTLRDLGIWDIIYEHISYFTPASLCTAFNVAGFEVLDVGALFGNQYIYIETKPGPARHPVPLSGSSEIELLVQNFDEVYRDKIKHWRDYLAARDPHQTVVWGAGSKGITFVNAVPGADRISALIDINPHKQGRFVPGTGAPVLPPDALRGRRLQSIIVMNPLYRDEIASTAAALGLTPEIVIA